MLKHVKAGDIVLCELNFLSHALWTGGCRTFLVQARVDVATKAYLEINGLRYSRTTGKPRVKGENLYIKPYDESLDETEEVARLRNLGKQSRDIAAVLHELYRAANEPVKYLRDCARDYDYKRYHANLPEIKAHVEALAKLFVSCREDSDKGESKCAH